MNKSIYARGTPKNVIQLSNSWFAKTDPDHPSRACLRLLTDPLMESVWRRIHQKKPLDRAQAYLDANFEPIMTLEGGSSPDIHERACAAIFLMCLKATSENGEVISSSDHKAMIKRYRAASEVLKEIRYEGTARDVAFEPDLADSFRLVENYLIRNILELVRDDNPSRVERDSGDRAIMRSALRNVAHVTIGVFGVKNPEYLVNIIDIIFKPDPELGSEDVKNGPKVCKIAYKLEINK